MWSVGHISKNCSKKLFRQEMLYRDQLRKGTVNGIPTDKIVLDTGASTTIVHQRMVSEKDYTGDAVVITDSVGTTRICPKAQVTIQLQEDQKFSQELAVSEVVPEDVLFEDELDSVLLENSSLRNSKRIWISKLGKQERI